MLKEHSRVVLTEDIAPEGLKSGDVGTIVHIYPGGKAFEVEFFSLSGQTVAVATVELNQLRQVTSTDVTHARPIAVA